MCITPEIKTMMKSGLPYDIALKIFAQIINLDEIINRNLKCVLPYAKIDSSNVLDFIEMCIETERRTHMLNYICKKKVEIPKWSNCIIESRHFELFKWTYECCNNDNFLEIYFRNLVCYSPIKVFEFLSNVDGFFAKKVNKFTLIACECRINLLKWMVNKYSLEQIFECYEYSEIGNYLMEIIKTIVDVDNFDFSEKKLFKLLKYFKNIYPELYFENSYLDLLTFAAKYKFWKTFHWLYKQSAEITESTIYCLAVNGRIDILKEFYKSNPELFNVEIFSEAAKGGQINVIKWMLETNKEMIFSEVIDYRIANIAAEHGKINILEWLKAREVLPAGIFIEVVANNHLNVLKWLHKNKIPKRNQQYTEEEIVNRAIYICYRYEIDNKVENWIKNTYCSE